ncbi:hypothetical protein [Maribacter aquivivus]|uniref:hypothetical protein n=1 Tax=Maribacter aquivivus TaxID=228958 RepID=UPI0024959C16|nr:hypothetical protein [Maribacter aquivivus]
MEYKQNLQNTVYYTHNRPLHTGLLNKFFKEVISVENVRTLELNEETSRCTCIAEINFKFQKELIQHLNTAFSNRHNDEYYSITNYPDLTGYRERDNRNKQERIESDILKGVEVKYAIFKNDDGTINLKVIQKDQFFPIFKTYMFFYNSQKKN